MATKREEIIVGIGGDSKMLLKELNMTRGKLQSWAKDISKEVASGSIPEAWKQYSKNVKDALSQTDKAGKDLGKSLGDNLKNAAMKGVAALLGFQAVKKLFVEINNSMKEVSDNIEKFGGKVSIKGFQEAKMKDLYGGMSEHDQMELAGAQAQKTGLFESLKIQAAKFGALATSSALTYGGMLKGKSFSESSSEVRGEQKAIWAEMKALKLKEDAAKSIDKQVKAEKERLRLKEEYNKRVDEEMKKWREMNAIQRGVQQGRQDVAKARQENMKQRIRTAADYNEQALYDNLPGNPDAGERRNAEQAALTERIREYGARKPKTIRERMKENLDAKNKERLTAQDTLNKLASIIRDDAMLVKVKLAK